MTSRAPQAYANVERLLERRYARSGLGFVVGNYAAAIALSMLIYGLAAVGLTINFDGSTADLLFLVVLVETVIVIVLPLSFVIWMRRKGRPGVAWARGERSAEMAPAAWQSAISTPTVLPIINFALAIPVMAVCSVVVSSRLDAGAAGVFVIFAGVLIVAGGIAGLAIFGAQFAIRPMLRDIAPYLPADAAFVRSRFGIARQLRIRLIVVGLLMTLAGGIVALISDDPVGRLALIISAGPAIIVMLGVVIFPLTTMSLVSPVNELIDATRRVADGDLEASVAVLTSDELGELSYSFNAMTADLRRTTEDLREASARIVASSDAARRKVERDLHDGAQQHFVLVDLKLGLLERKLAQDPEEARALLAELRHDIGRGLAELRELAHGIYPAVLENEGLEAALRDAATRTAIPARVECDGGGRYEPEVEAAVYFCCLEALQNAAKHAGRDATATVKLWGGITGLRFEVADDGAGFDAVADAASAGLQNMADRIGALGGELSVDSAPGRGTRVRGRVPV